MLTAARCMLSVEDGSRCRDLTLKLTRIGVCVGSALVFKLLCSAFFSALVCALLCALKLALRSYAHKRLQIQESQQNHPNFWKFTSSIHKYEQTIIWELCTKNAPWTELRQNWVVDFKKGIWDLTSSEQSARAEQEHVFVSAMFVPLGALLWTFWGKFQSRAEIMSSERLLYRPLGRHRRLKKLAKIGD